MCAKPAPLPSPWVCERRFTLTVSSPLAVRFRFPLPAGAAAAAFAATLSILVKRFLHKGHVFSVSLH
jgi:hypothetical protein